MANLKSVIRFSVVLCALLGCAKPDRSWGDNHFPDSSYSGAGEGSFADGGTSGLSEAGGDGDPGNKAGGDGGASAGASAGGADGRQDCLPATSECRSGGLVICDESGHWIAPVRCPFVCLEGRCAGSCTPGTQRCVDNHAQTCSLEGEWLDGAFCPAICEKGSCVASCTEGAQSCDDLAPQSCVGGVWKKSADCPFLCRDGLCIGECKPGELQCRGRVLQICNADGKMELFQACSNACFAGQCTGTCVPGTNQCISSTQLRTCNERGVWEASQSCGGKACYQQACTGECEPKAIRCQNGDAEVCDPAGVWMIAQDCLAPDQLCQNGACVQNVPYDVGFLSPFVSTGSMAKDRMYLFQLTPVSTQVWLVKMGLMGAVDTPANINVKLVLYGNDSSSGKPGKVLARTDDVLLVPGPSAGLAVPGFVTLEANTLYWVGVIFSGQGGKVLRTTAGGPPAVYSLFASYFSTPKDNPLAAEAPVLGNEYWNLFMNVQNVVN